ncbi:transglycosylase domain-containing protein [Mesobacterium pallidum]|uniref:transglycosylase domain-containing protein n=1 Tax=Mesobacterium pallidum TaxID=2872037 RepID=UPI001EE36190|nr:PBP1A family penicillin-binding protein [Mesobacterium pallidum]
MSDSGRRKPPLVAERRFASKTTPAKGAAKPKPKAAAKPKAKAKARKAAPRRRRNPVLAFFGGIIRFVLRVVWGFGWRLGAIAALILGLAVLYIYSTLPPVSEVADGRARGSVTMMDRYGQVFAWRGEQFGGLVTAETVSPHLKNAVVATEDKRFYRHFGISPRGIASAVRINLREGRGPLSGHGGSTITQQTAKLMCLGVEYDPKVWKTQTDYENDCRQGSLMRKGKEALYAIAMEVKYTKDEILTIYLNRAYMGGGAHGAEAAAQRFFGKHASELAPSEGAMLAGLLTAPTRFAPTADLERAQNRAAVVVGLMEEQGYLTGAEADYALANPAELSEAAEARAGGYFADWVLTEVPDFLTLKTSSDLVIRTTLDQRIQRAAETALADIFETKVREGSKAQAAIVVMSADGAVRAMVGGRKANGAGLFNRAVQARRQTGSAFKPFVYAAALDVGHSPYSTVVDEPYCLNIPGSGEWCPKNYTNQFYGRVTLIEALKNSLNIPAVKVSEEVGRDIVRTVADQFGLASDLAAGPALALGASESTLIEMTGAYAGILNGGSSVAPYGMIDLRMRDDNDPLIEQQGGIGERVIQPHAARQLVWMMEKVVSEGTGSRARLPDRQAAGKTGTTQAARDAWFVGFTADYVAGVWMGYDDNTPLTGVTGGGLPAEIWHEVMVRVNEGVPVSELPMDVPEAPRAAPAPQPQQQPQTVQRAPAPQPQRSDDPVARVIDNVLRDIFGGN